jgi:hypothetical protein
MLKRYRTHLLSVSAFAVMALLAAGSLPTTPPSKTGGPAVGGATTTSAPNSNGGAAAADPKQVALRDVKLDFKWAKGGFGSVMLADFTIDNPTPYTIKDIEVKCVHSAPSGTEIDSNTRTIYEMVKPKSKKVVRGFNMGLINSQASSSACRIEDLEVVP